MRGLITFACLLVASAAVAADGQIVGWRGNGSGCYPTATPPTQWGRTSTGLKQIRYQAAKPKGDASAGKSLADGVIRQWLVLGPVAVPAAAKADTAKFEMIKGEADLAPDAGDKVGKAAWKAADSEDEMLDFASLWGKKTNVVAYAAVYLWSPADQTMLLDINSSSSTLLWVNGKEALRISEKTWPIGFQQANLPLKKGWNRLLLRIMANTGWNAYAWFMRPVVYGDPRGPYETKNVRWTVPIGGMAEPIVVGERLFLLSEPYDLVCLDKNSGKILWARSVNYFEATPEADRKGNPLFDEAAKLAAELNWINDACGTPAGPSKEQLAAKAEAQKKLYATMVKINAAKYTLTRQQDFGMAGFVPMSDGKNVWAWFASGITACYDLDGNRRWITLDNRPGEQHHGYQTSPLLVGGKVILYMYDIEALDAKTGKVAWTKPICKDPKNEHWWSAIGGGFCTKYRRRAHVHDFQHGHLPHGGWATGVPRQPDGLLPVGRPRCRWQYRVQREERRAGVHPQAAGGGGQPHPAAFEQESQALHFRMQDVLPRQSLLGRPRAFRRAAVLPEAHRRALRCGR